MSWWSYEKTLKSGEKPKLKREDCQVFFDEQRETDHISQKQLDAAQAAAEAACEGIAGKKLLSVQGHEDSGDAPNAQHLVVTVSRVLAE